MNTGLLEDVSRDPGLAPSGVIDPLALAIFRCDLDEGFFESGQVVFDLFTAASEATLQIAPFLDQVDPLQGVGVGDTSLDFGEPLQQRFDAHLASTLRLVLLESDEVATHRVALTTTCGKRVLVLVRQGRLCCSLPGRHSPIVTLKPMVCKSGHRLRADSFKSQMRHSCTVKGAGRRAVEAREDRP